MWTKGRGFPLSRLETRLRCPMCGSRDVALMITMPRETQTVRVRSKEGAYVRTQAGRVTCQKTTFLPLSLTAIAEVA